MASRRVSFLYFPKVALDNVGEGVDPRGCPIGWENYLGYVFIFIHPT